MVHNAEPGMGSPSWFEYYVQNVTDNTPEVKLVDTRVPKVFGNSSGSCPGCADWNPSTIDGLFPTNGARGFAIDLFHGANGSVPCQGYAGIAYVLAAAWSTDSGQRIGPAVEIEGNASPDSISPAAPKNLLVAP